MRPLLIALLAAAAPAQAEIRRAADCAPAIAADAQAAREAAALWARTGGGVPARLCEAAALSALGAHATAARLLGGVGTNPNRALGDRLRAVILTDAAGEWLAAGQPALALESLDSADRLAPPEPAALMLRARAGAALGDWDGARAALEALLAVEPRDALARALLAAALRRGGDPQAALAEAERALATDPGLPEALFEAAAARAETGDSAGAAELWLRLVETNPGHDLAGPARRNLQALN
jgi:tetratricopeptide (TPR) repeat protein